MAGQGQSPRRRLDPGHGAYDDSLVKGGKLTKRDLDAAFPNHKVMVLHVSLHGAVLNSKAFEWAGLSS